MKKVVLIAIILYVCTALTLLYFADADPKKITLLTVPQPYARVITDESERLGVVICVDQTDTFFTTVENIRSMRIWDDESELVVSVEQIIPLSETIIYGEKYFSLYRFEIGFGEIAQANMTLSFFCASAEIAYENDYIFSFVLGDVQLIFNDLTNEGHIGLARLYGTRFVLADQSVLTGFVIGLEKYVSSLVTITGIEIFSETAWVDLETAHWIEEAVSFDEDIAVLSGNPAYSSLRSEKPETVFSIAFGEDGLLFAPINYKNEFSFLSQFPIRITYQYLDQEYAFLLDDFRFFSTDPFPEVLRDDIVKTEYCY